MGSDYEDDSESEVVQMQSKQVSNMNVAGVQENA